MYTPSYSFIIMVLRCNARTVISVAALHTPWSSFCLAQDWRVHGCGRCRLAACQIGLRILAANNGALRPNILGGGIRSIRICVTQICVALLCAAVLCALGHPPQKSTNPKYSNQTRWEGHQGASALCDVLFSVGHQPGELALGGASGGISPLPCPIFVGHQPGELALGGASGGISPLPCPIFCGSTAG